jgi:capsular polysaccharide export protein
LSLLLLQGPIGPFFKDLAQVLRQQYSVPVYRIVFNGGDLFFGESENTYSYKGTVEDWPTFFTDFIRDKKITSVLAYGDCRIYHSEAKRLSALEDGVRYFAFEEGYLRPNYITLEEGGVNGHSPVNRDAVEVYQPIHSPKGEEVIGGNFLNRMLFALAYDLLATFSTRKSFFHYQHHRPLTPFLTALYWNRGFLRKLLYRVAEPSCKKIARKGDFYLVPLQVHYDAQIEFHSQYEKMEDFIVDVLRSFKESDCKENLFFKHHPMDRGHVNYRQFILNTARNLGLEKQVYYIHDQHLPTLLKACRGVVTINSTTALQAFYHRAPVKAVGAAFFDMPGLTYQGDLHSFWLNPSGLDGDFSDRFKAYLLDHGQINGSFYSKLDLTIGNVIDYLAKQKAISLEVDPKRDGVRFE